MNGWILYKNDIKESYETQKLIEEFEKQDFKVRVVNPQDVDIFVDRDDRKSILVAGKSRPLPVDLDKDRLKVMIKEMYIEAQDITP